MIGFEEESVDLTPGVVWTDEQLDVVRQLVARLYKGEATLRRAEALTPGPNVTDHDRERLVEAMYQARFIYYEDMADALMPLIDRIANERAAVELRTAADVIYDQARTCDDEGDTRGHNAYAWAAIIPRSRAAILDPK